MAVSDITIAPASIYVGGTAPADGTLLTLDSNGIPQSLASTPMGGVSVGMTGGPAIFTLERKLREVMVQQYLAPVMVRAISEQAMITFTLSEHLLTTIQKFMSGSLISQVTSPTPKFSGVVSANTAVVPATPFVFVAKDVVTGFYRAYMLYLGYIADKIEIGFDKEKETMIKVTVKSLIDTTRTSATSGNLYQIVEQHS